MPIDKVRIRGVRGIRSELTLDLGGSSLVLRGDNGTGKSSIVAGLLWGLRGDEEPIPKAKAGSEESYRANVLEGAKNAQVSIEIKGGGSIVVKPGEAAADGKGEALRVGCRRSTPFLLRRQLLRFLNDKPIDRFKYLEAFLDLEEADEVREAFSARAESHTKAAEEHRRTSQVLLRPVVDCLPRDLIPASVSWSTVVAALAEWGNRMNVLAATAEWNGLLGAAERLRPLLAGDELARRRVAVQRVLRAADDCVEIAVPTDPSSLLEQRDKLMAAASDSELSTLLEGARTHFARHADAPSCPLCEQAIDAKEVAARIAARLAVLTDLKEVRNELADRGAAWQAYWASTARVRTAVTELQGAPAPQPAPPNAASLSEIRDATAFAEAVGRIGASDLIDWASRAVGDAKVFAVSAAEKLPAEEDTSAVRKLVQAIEHADKARLAVIVAESSAEDAGGRAKVLSTIHEALRTARQDVAKELLDDISMLVTEFYGVVHPPDADDEITGPPEIVVQRRSGGTAHVRGRFHAKAVEDPRWVYSDGHLDTVGICVYLALRRFRASRDASSDPKLMILDDIVLSVDLGHGRRLLDLLRTRFDDHQVLILTHNGLFADWCVEKLPKYKHKAIARWSVETGPQLGEYRSMMDRIEQQIETETSPKLLAQAVMNLMDEWLAQARFEYELSVRARRGEQYTLTDIWNPFARKMKDLEKNLKAPVGDLGAVIGDLGALVPMRNKLAAHENGFAHEFPLAAVRQIAKRCVELVRLLYCPKCPAFAVPIPNGDAPDLIRCRANCEHIRYDRPRKPQA